ncbi:hypothetical protein [Bacillus solitudinis]|uniref:hypothetical protein n=1 Tax=Bacillus solitudinis TaxID=2014074 RepID=UPI000C23A0C8|nr:hypothetical protein [Bacillus solitudinis]
MSFHPQKMSKFIEKDRFLSNIFEEINQHLQNENEALLYLYNVYIQQEPILLNAYNLLVE